jgi:DNA-binding transcriptional MerR regulator
MMRKRDAYTRARAKRSRPKTPAPQTGWRIAELASISHVPLRTLRYYIARRLLVPTEFRGVATRYQRPELMRLLGILRMQTELRLSLSEIDRRLRALGDQRLEDWLRSGPLPPDAAAALGFSLSVAAANTISTPTPSGNPSPELALDAARHSITTWQRLEIAPGVELLVSTAASSSSVLVANKIYETFVGRSEQR